MLSAGPTAEAPARPPVDEAALTRWRQLAGITRLADLTGLDVLGVPVVAAIRPNSRSLAVHQGKGLSRHAARVSAVMEAMECHAAEQCDLTLRLAAPGALSGAVDVAALPRARGGADPRALRLLWVAGRRLRDGDTAFVPREMVAADWAHPLPPGPAVFQATTNGLGAGLSEAAARHHALCEVIERDAVAIWRARPDAMRRGTRFDPRSVTGVRSRALLDNLAAAGAWVTLWDATSDIGVPVFLVALGDEAGRLPPELGSACRQDPDVALSAALMEAAQSRLTVISGARDDFDAADYAPAERHRAAASWRAGNPSGDYASRAAGADPGQALLDREFDPVVVRLPLPDPTLHVVKVVVPGLEGGHTGPDGDYVPGARARHAAGD